jgi:hypothetical protein
MPELPVMVASVGSRRTLCKPINRHSSEWTHVISRLRNQDISEEALSDLFHRSARRVETPVVAPKKDDLRSPFYQEGSPSRRKKVVRKVSFQDWKPKSKPKNSFHMDHISVKFENANCKKCCNSQERNVSGQFLSCIHQTFIETKL